MSKGAPCSTYGSPPLGGGDERFEFAHVEVWVVRREETDDDAVCGVVIVQVLEW